MESTLTYRKGNEGETWTMAFADFDVDDIFAEASSLGTVRVWASFQDSPNVGYDRDKRNFGIVRQQRSQIINDEHVWKGRASREWLRSFKRAERMAATWRSTYAPKDSRCRRPMPHRRVLTNDQAFEMRIVFATGTCSMRELSVQFGVHSATVRGILVGDNYRDVPGPLHLPRLRGRDSSRTSSRSAARISQRPAR